MLCFKSTSGEQVQNSDVVAQVHYSSPTRLIEYKVITLNAKLPIQTCD